MSYLHQQADAKKTLATRRKAPGILRLLPENLPFYPYRETADGNKHLLHLARRKKRNADVEKHNPSGDSVAGDQFTPIPDAPLYRACDEDAGFTLFFFVDSTNRQSLLAIPLVSQWFHHALNGDGNESTGSRVICIPNQSTPNEISLRNSNSDPIVQASVNSSITSVAKQNIPSMLTNTGFYHLPFLHPTRLALLHLLGATRVPCAIVVSNVNGRIVSLYGWEAIQREGRSLEEWSESRIEKNKGDCEKLGCDANTESSTPSFESPVAKEWNNGKSGLPLWWHMLSWVI